MSRDFSPDFVDTLIVAIDRRRKERQAREAFAGAYRDALRVLTSEQIAEVIASVDQDRAAAAQRKSYLTIRRDVPRETATEEVAELLRSGFSAIGHEEQEQE